MKTLILLSLLLLPYYTFSQTKKPAVKVTPTTKAVINPEEKVKINAEKWFKDFYVEKMFKDPYSYKLMKITSERIETKKAIQDSITYLENEIANCKLPLRERNTKERQENEEFYNDGLKSIKELEENLKSEKDQGQIDSYYRQIAIHKKYALIALDRMKDYDIFIVNSNEKLRLENKLKSLQPGEAEKFSYYRINLDCYSKNSLGNEVLGRFQFPFSAQGPFGSNNGLDTIIKLNKE